LTEKSLLKILTGHLSGSTSSLMISHRKWERHILFICWVW